MRRTTELPVSAETAYDWHARPGALERLSPPWERVDVLQRADGLEEGELAVLRVRRGPLSRRWVALHGDPEPGRCFRDDQLSGPFSEWHHVHRFTPNGADSCLLEDEVTYELPLGGLGGAVAGPAVARRLERLFAFRHRRTADDLRRHAAYARRPLRVAVAGATGMLGTELASFLRAGGHDVLGIVRGEPRGPEEIRWHPDSGRAPRLDALEGLDGVVNVTGEDLGARWTDARRAAILGSRVDTTTTLASALGALERPPRLFISMSGVGHYGDRGDEMLDESCSRGSGFLTDVTDVWERATEPAWRAGVPTVILRSGIILSAKAGALRKMLPAFLTGAGGPIGGGEQWMSWLSFDDYLGIVYWLLCGDGSEPPTGEPLVINATSPQPVRNREFVKTLGKVLRRPAVAPLPAAAVRALFGEMGVQTLLYSQRAQPKRLQDAGFRFLYPRLEDALRLELGRLRPGGA